MRVLTCRVNRFKSYTGLPGRRMQRTSTSPIKRTIRLEPNPRNPKPTSYAPNRYRPILPIRRCKARHFGRWHRPSRSLLFRRWVRCPCNVKRNRQSRTHLCRYSHGLRCRAGRRTIYSSASSSTSVCQRSKPGTFSPRSWIRFAT